MPLCVENVVRINTFLGNCWQHILQYQNTNEIHLALGVNCGAFTYEE